MDASEVRSALRIVARVLDDGEVKHPPGSPTYWLAISMRQHSARALVHLDKFMVGAQTGEDHLAHAAARLLLALEQRERLREGDRADGKNRET
jgi:hypothetical protein